jgi:hypothetical protein
MRPVWVPDWQKSAIWQTVQRMLASPPRVSGERKPEAAAPPPPVTTADATAPRLWEDPLAPLRFGDRVRRSVYDTRDGTPAGWRYGTVWEVYQARPGTVNQPVTLYGVHWDQDEDINGVARGYFRQGLEKVERVAEQQPPMPFNQT